MIYTYKIISVDEIARSMEVVYTHETHGSMHVGARLPFEGEPLENVIRQFAPVAYWLDLEIPVSVPQVGTTGTMEELQEPAVEDLHSNEVLL
jgi:hypothetical protein